jgi:hypothetical protein
MRFLCNISHLYDTCIDNLIRAAFSVCYSGAEILSSFGECIARLGGLDTVGHGDDIFRAFLMNPLQYTLNGAVVGSWASNKRCGQGIGSAYLALDNGTIISKLRVVASIRALVFADSSIKASDIALVSLAMTVYTYKSKAIVTFIIMKTSCKAVWENEDPLNCWWSLPIQLWCPCASCLLHPRRFHA